MSDVDEHKTGSNESSDGSGGNAGTGNGENGVSDGGGNTGKVTFTPEQQSRVQSLINEAYNRSQIKSSSEMAALKNELESLKVNKEQNKEENKGEDLSAWQDRIAKMEERERQSNERNKRASILTVASELDAVNGEQVAQLLMSNVKVTDAGTLIVLNAEGQPRLNANLQPMTVRESVAEFLNANPHHVKAGGGAGAGSQGSKFGADGGKVYDLSDPKTIQTMPKDALDAAIKEGINVPGSAGQVFHFGQPRNPFIEARQRRFKKGE